MKVKYEIEELNAKFEHLQDRFDNLRDYVKEKPEICAEGYWNKFEDLLVYSRDFDKNSEEWNIITKACWELLDEYLNIILTKPLGKDK